MKNIYDLIQQKELAFKQQERVLESIKRELDALRLAATLLADDQDQPSTGAAPSQHQMVRAVLLEKNQPMHVNEIVDSVKKKYRKNLKSNHIVALIYRYKKLGKMFYKVEGKPSTFGLLEWQARASEPIQQQANVH